MYRFLIIFGVFMCVVVLLEAHCVDIRDSWWKNPWYRCIIKLRMSCNTGQRYVRPVITAWDHDVGSEDDQLGYIFIDPLDCPITPPLQLVFYGSDGRYGGNLELYLTITHNCGPDARTGDGYKVYKPYNDGKYLGETTDLGIIDLSP